MYPIRDDIFWIFSISSLKLSPFCQYSAGMLWSGDAPDVKALEENMETYFNILHGFVLLCHGSTVGAGPTLHASINASVKQVIDCSIALLKEAVSTCGVYLTLLKLCDFMNVHCFG